MMSTGETFDIPLATAQTYEAAFVPALFAEWAPLLVDAVGVRPGDSVLDVGCGTGIVTRTVADRIGARGTVVGLDLNPAMLAVAALVRPDIHWQQGDVDRLPFPDRAFDVVLCQMAMMFFPDPVRALREMVRVTVDSGAVGVVVPAALADQPAYREFVRVAQGHAGPEAGALLATYWACGDQQDLQHWFQAAGLAVVSVETHHGTARFASSDDLVATEVNGSPLATRISPDVYEQIRRDTAHALAGFVTPDGQFRPPLVGHIITARPRRNPDR